MIFSDVATWITITEHYPGDLIRVEVTQNTGYSRSDLITISTASGVYSQIFIQQDGYADLNGGYIYISSSGGTTENLECNENPSLVNSGTGAFGGNGSYTYQWQYQEEGSSTWNIISNSNSATYDPPTIFQTTRIYRRKVTSASFSTYSNSVTFITPGGELHPGAIYYQGGIVCPNGSRDPSTIGEGTGAFGGDGVNYAYQWQYSNNGTSGWTTIAGQTGSSYNPPSGLPNTRWYKRIVSSCGFTAETDPVMIPLGDTFSEGSILGTSPVCYGGNPGLLASGSLPTGGNENYTYQWQSSSDGVSWTNITNATSISYDPPVLASSTWYQRLDSSCGISLATNAVQVVVYAALSGGTISISGANPICYSGDPGVIQSTLPRAGGDPTSFSYQWEYYDTNSSTWEELLGETGLTYDPLSGMTNSTKYRRKVYSCNETAYSNEVEILVYQNLIGGGIYISGDSSICPDEDPSELRNGSSAYLGDGNYTYLWQYNITDPNNANNWVDIQNSNSENYDPPVALTNSTWYRRVVTSCGQTAYSNTIFLQLNESQTWYADTDGDNLGDPAVFLIQCSQPLGYILDNTDMCPDIASPDNSCIAPPEDPNPLDQSYIYTRNYQISRATIPDQIFDEGNDGIFNDENDYIQGITYFDGLGRPMQKNAIRQSPDQKDIITHIGYDGFGRHTKEWLPLYEPIENIGSFRIGDIGYDTNSYYKNHPMFAQDFPTFTESEANAYSEKELEPSSLSRVVRQAAPGEDWALGEGHEISFGYSANTNVDGVVIFEVSLNFVDGTYVPDLMINGLYQEGELYKTITRDENHDGSSSRLHTTEEFTDKTDRLILKRTYALVNGVEEAHDTYYVYDDYGNLTYVLPPLMEATTATLTNIVNNLDDLGYQYKYDHRNRLVEKRVPGKGWEYVVYDKLDQPILTQDANQRESDEWSFTKYDAFGRVVYTGLYTSGPSEDREDMQGYVDDTSTYELYEEPQGSSINFGQADVYYTNDTFPDSNMEVLTINYYDGYDFLANESITSLPATVFGNNELQVVNYNGGNLLLTKGLATGSKVKVLETNDWITTATGYDDKGRAIYSHSENEYLGTTDILENKLDFTGKPLQVYTSHTKDGATIATLDNFEYDHVGRLLKQTQCIGDETLGYDCEALEVEMNATLDGDIVTSGKTAIQSITVIPGATGSTTLSGTLTLQIDSNANSGGGISIDEELIAYNKYDDLGQLEEKKIGGTPNTTYDLTEGLQTVDYTYNVRGWLKTINDSTTLGDDLFAFKINYNSTELGSPNVDSLYNGNISETIWTTVNDASGGYTRGYAYQYDALNRITNADYGVKTTGNYNLGSGYDLRVDSYDKNGNIESLFRNSSTPGDAQDDIRYAYSGNQLSKVDELATTTQKDEGFKDGTNTGNDYDYDANGNLTMDLNKGIQANGITYNHLNLPTNIVTGSGNILYVYDAVGTKLQKTAGSSVTSYAGNFVYSGPSGSEALQFMGQPEGYVTPDGMGGYDYVYQYKDHLGNIRLSYTDDPSNPGTPTTIDENNYYPFGLKHKGYNTGGDNSLGNDLARLYKFGGKELDGSYNGVLSTYDFGARNYDPTLGRWMNLDPLAEKYLNMTPYNFTLNNPIIFVDPDGMRVEWADGLNEDEKEILGYAIYFLRKNSKTFDKAFSELHSSEVVFKVGKTGKGGPWGLYTRPSENMEGGDEDEDGMPTPVTFKYDLSAGANGGKISVNLDYYKELRNEGNDIDPIQEAIDVFPEELSGAALFLYYGNLANGFSDKMPGAANIEYETKMLSGIILNEASVNLSRSDSQKAAQQFGIDFAKGNYTIKDYFNALKTWHENSKTDPYYRGLSKNNLRPEYTENLKR